MKIKDLSSSNKVAGEGLIQWRFQDLSRDTVALDLPGYHIKGQMCVFLALKSC
jgi:hypothetical protein